MKVSPAAGTVVTTRRRFGRRLVTLCCAAAVLTALIVMLASLASAATSGFADVPAGHPYHAAISDLSARGIIGGYANGGFGPDDPVMRQQFAKMVVLTGGYAVSEADVCPFTDVATSGASSFYPDNYVAVCAAHGITTGKTASSFDPTGKITRLQAVTMVVRMADDLQPGLLATPPDGWLGSTAWTVDATHGANAARAEYNGLLAGLALDALDPRGDMSRGEVAQVLHNLLGKLPGSTPWTYGPTTSSTVTTTTTPGSVSTVNLVFIHHSVGANWLNDALCKALNEKGYHVADIYYGWTGGTGYAYGDHTDTGDWPTWFTDKVMRLVYPELGQMTAPNAISPAPGENTVIMFKSCFPNSEVGSDISDEKAVYNSLLPYFQAHPGKMFVLCTPPPMQSVSHPAKTRELCNWLADRQNGWLKNLTTGNVFVFDLYNVLTDPNAHHRLVNGAEVHQVVSGHNTLYYDSGGDDHPSTTGNVKANTEFVPLLDTWYGQFKASRM